MVDNLVAIGRMMLSRITSVIGIATVNGNSTVGRITTIGRTSRNAL